MTPVAQVLLVLHSLSGAVIEVNPSQITHLRNPELTKDHSFTDKARCMVNMADGKYITVLETCEYVRRAIEELKK